MKILKGIGLVIFGTPICIAVGDFLVVEGVVFLMMGGLALIIMAIIFEDDE